MRKKIMIVTVLIFTAGIIALNTGCEDDPKEACQQDMFCDGTVSVTACCTDGKDCYYTYNGKEYPDTEEGLAQLIEDLNCTTAKKSEVEESPNVRILERLTWLLEETRILSQQN